MDTGFEQLVDAGQKETLVAKSIKMMVVIRYMKPCGVAAI